MRTTLAAGRAPGHVVWRVPSRWVAVAVGAALLLGGGAGAVAASMLPGVTPPAADAPAAEGSASADNSEVPAAAPVARQEPIPPTVTELVNEGAMVVGVERWLEFGFTTPDAGEACRLTGHVLGLRGGNEDVEVYVFTADDYVNWQTHPRDERWRYAPVFSSPRQTATTLDVTLPNGGAEYHLVVSNRFSLATEKDVQTSARVTCR